MHIRNVAISFALSLAIPLALACGGGSDDGEKSDDDGGGSSEKSASPTVTKRTNLTAKQWSHEVCTLADAFFTLATTRGNAIAAVAPESVGAQDKIVAEYGQMVAGLTKYARGVEALPPGKFDGGDAVKDLWVRLTSESEGQLKALLADVKALPAAPQFADAYFDLTGDFRDDNSDQNLRGELHVLAVEHPKVQDVIDALDDDEKCARVGGE